MFGGLHKGTIVGTVVATPLARKTLVDAKNSRKLKTRRQ